MSAVLSVTHGDMSTQTESALCLARTSQQNPHSVCLALSFFQGTLVCIQEKFMWMGLLAPPAPAFSIAYSSATCLGKFCYYIVMTL